MGIFKKIQKLCKYILPYRFMVIAIWLNFLIIQSCALFLPTLMSDIVDVGVRQNGIKNPSFEVMPQKAYDFFSNFMTEQEKEILENSYYFWDNDKKALSRSDLLQENEISNLKEKITSKYKNAFKSDMYILKSDFYKRRTQLDGIFLEAISRLFRYLGKNSLSEKYFYFDQNEFFIDLNGLYDILLDFESLPMSEFEEKDEDLKFDKYQAAAAIGKQIYIELGMDISKLQRNYILKTGLLMMSFAAVALVFTILENFLSCKVSSGILKKLREDVFSKIENFSQKEFDKIGVSSLITRTIDDVNQVKEAVMSITSIVVPPIMLIAGTYMSVKKSQVLSFIIILGAVISVFIILAMFIKILPKMELLQKILDKFNLVLRQRLSGIMVVTSFGNIQWEEEKFDKLNKEFSNISSYVNSLVLRLSPCLVVVMNFFGLLIIWFSSKEIAQSNMQIGDLMAFLQYSSMIIGAFMMIGVFISSVPVYLISIDRVIEILDIKPSVRDPKQENCKLFSENDFKSSICFKDVWFTYGEKENMVLKDISFCINKGETVAIVGPIGSGKSTLVSLITRVFDVTSGEITIDDINIKDVLQHKLREKITYVPQKSFIFSGNIDHNLRYSNQNLSDENLFKCVKESELCSLVSNKDDLKRKISQDGKDLSGGQKQKISIARALLRNTPVYIFDDSFSAMDYISEIKIRENIKKFRKNATMIFVSQRIATILDAEKIIVLDKGRIVDCGNHGELIKRCKEYREIAKSQLEEEVKL